jgi:type IV pilus assembly protein PilW
MRLRNLAAGFSLIELMIGMALGLLSVLIITQVMSLFEAQRRTTTGSADAQTNGGIALFSIARDMQQAGYGLLPITDSALECSTPSYGGMGITGMAPISITDGASGASDTITIRYATSQMAGAVAQITAMNQVEPGAATVGSNLGCQNGDVILVSSGASCAFTTAAAVASAPVVSITPANSNLVAQGAFMACLGTWTEVTYAVDSAGNLTRTVRVDGVSNGTTVKNVVTGTMPSVVGVVSLQAQYGVTASGNSNQVTQWVNATGGTWAAPTVANRNRIKAVRIAVIARNAKIELESVSTACSSTTAAAPTGLCAWEGTTASPAPAVDLSPGDANWNRYRYRVFETIIPLRNVIWAKDTL